MVTTQKKIIIAPLNWGLGHATRCIPIIKALLVENFIPILASDGTALQFLKKEFPNLETIKLPSYNITYSKNLKLSLVFQFPKILKAVKEEQKVIETFLAENINVCGIISDNRFGARSTKVPSVYITHQINIKAGFASYFASKIHQNIIAKFNECWIPDTEDSKFSGMLSITKRQLNKKFIGVLSRFKKQDSEKNIDVLIILSGLEPNRTLLEEQLISVFKNDTRKITFVLGKLANTQKSKIQNNFTFYNFLLTKELEKLINSSKIVICRSGYSSIMDLAVLDKKVFFIPTKHQPEQEYLANYLEKAKYAPFCSTQTFSLQALEKLENYKGLTTKQKSFDVKLFRLF